MDCQTGGPKGVAMSRILLADDDHAVRGVLKVVLERAGHFVIAAGDGVEALEKLKEQPVDYALLDIEMPRMGGIDVCGMMRADPAWRHIPVTLMTGRPVNGVPERVRAVGARDLILKPFDRQDLLAKIKEHIEGARGGSPA